MGYTTEFFGSFSLNKPLDDELFVYLKQFSSTRRVLRSPEKLEELGFGSKEKFGVQGEFFACSEEEEKLAKDSILNYNTPPSTQPGLWCQWIPSEDKQHIVWDGVEKFYEADNWIKYLIRTILKPKGYVLNGIVAAKGQSSDDFWTIEIINNDVTISEGWTHIMLESPIIQKEMYFLYNNGYFFATKAYISQDPEWCDIKDEDYYYNLATFSTKEEAEQMAKTIRLRSMFQSPDFSLGKTEILKVSKHFVLLNQDTIVRERTKEDQRLELGLYQNQLYEFDENRILVIEQ